jgi:hypothetical protein
MLVQMQDLGLNFTYVTGHTPGRINRNGTVFWLVAYADTYCNKFITLTFDAVSEQYICSPVYFKVVDHIQIGRHALFVLDD